MLIVRQMVPNYRYFGIFFLLIATFCCSYLAMLQLTGNFHAVIPGQLYRSAQPSRAQLEDYVRQYGIKTIVNLRGRNEARWYAEETAVAERLGVQHIDFGMSATKILSVDKAKDLIDIMKSAPRPILVHCMSGADRTGLFSLIYSREVAGLPEEEAQWQLSFLFGHIGVPYISGAFAMERSWWDIEHHLANRARG